MSEYFRNRYAKVRRQGLNRKTKVMFYKINLAH